MNAIYQTARNDIRRIAHIRKLERYRDRVDNYSWIFVHLQKKKGQRNE